MKTKLFSLLAVGAMALGLTTACSDDNTFDASTGGEATVSFTVGLPTGVGSRADAKPFGDGTLATELQYYVYEQGKTNAIISGTGTFSSLKATIELKLVTGKTYDILFWADSFGKEGANSPFSYSESGKTITIDYAKITSNDDNYDAFYVKETVEVKGPISKDVVLTRPFAQVNFGTDDLDALALANIKENLTAQVVAKQVQNVLNLDDGTVSGTATEFTFAAQPFPSSTEWSFPYSATGKTYSYVAMDYILVGADKATMDLDLKILESNAEVNTVKVPNAPVQRNYRTNIYGSLLTSTVNFNVAIQPAFTESDYYEIAKDEATFSNALQDENIGEIYVTNDLDLSQSDATITITSDKTINVAEGATITLGTGIVADNGANLKVEGSGVITNIDATEAASYLNNAATTVSAVRRYTSRSTTIDKGLGLIRVNNGTLNLSGVSLVHDPTFHGKAVDGSRNGAIAYTGNCDITLEDCKIISGMCAICQSDDADNETTIVMRNCYLESNSSNNNGINGAWAYCVRLTGKSATIENCTIIGIQGAIAAANETATINGGNYRAYNSEGKTDGFYACYATSACKVTIYDGNFYGPEDRSKGMEIGGTSCVVVGDNDSGEELGEIIVLSGGKFSGKPYQGIDNGSVLDTLAEGYEWKAIEEGSADYEAGYRWQVVKTSAE